MDNSLILLGCSILKERLIISDDTDIDDCLCVEDYIEELEVKQGIYY